MLTGNTSSHFKGQGRRGAFTLIEMLVVVGIIAILMAAVVAVGTQVRAAAARHSTVAELHVLQNAMREYLAKGNPEPTAYNYTNWPYTLIMSNGSTSSYEAFLGPSDLTNWVVALRSDPVIAKEIAGFPTDTDAAGQPTQGHVVGGTAIAPQMVILDAYGTPIRYIPSTTAKEGYFISAGPDQKFSMEVNINQTYTNYGLRADELYSTDPQ